MRLVSIYCDSRANGAPARSHNDARTTALQSRKRSRFGAWLVLLLVSVSMSSCKVFSEGKAPTDVRITTASDLPPGTVGTAYSQVLHAEGGCTDNNGNFIYKWTTSDPLPSGITLSSDGHLSGTPTQATIMPITFLVRADGCGDDIATSLSLKMFSLTINKAAPAFSNLSASQAVLAGTPTVILTGKLAAGSVIPPTSAQVTATINQAISPPVNISASGNFSITFDTHLIPAAANSPYAITYDYAGDSNFNSTADSSTTLTVNPATVPEFAISALPASQAVAPGGSVGYTMTVTALNGFTASVSFSVSGLPATGFTPSFSPTTVNGSGNSSLTIGVDASVAVTTTPIPLTITGTSGALVHSVPVALSVVKAGVIQTVDATGDGSSFSATIGTANHFVVFFSNSTNLVSPATTEQNVFLSDISSGSTALVSTVNGSNPPIEGDINIFEGQFGLSAMSDDGRVVTFASGSTILVSPNTTNAVNVFLRYTCAGAVSGCTASTVLGSVNAASLEPDASSGGPPAMSPDGRYLLFTSDAKDILSPPPAPTSLGTELYMRDTCRNSDGTPVGGGCITGNMLISQTTGGVPSDTPFGMSFASTPGGRFVTFAVASQLVASPDSQVFLRDTCGLPNQPVSGCTPSTTLLSQDSSGVPGLGGSGQPSISADGRFVAFSSGATNFPGAIFPTSQVYLRDTCRSVNDAGVIPNCNNAPLTLISFATDGITSGNGESPTGTHSLSADGRFILFKSSATNLVSNSPSAVMQGVYVRDSCMTTTGPVASCTPATHLLSVDSLGTLLDVQNTLADAGAAISRDGHYAVFDFNAIGGGRIALAATGF